MPKNQDTTTLNRHQHSEIKTELETIFITSSGDKYISEMDAINAETKIQQAKELKQKRRARIMDIMEVILKVLKEENWGFYYKNEPMRSLNTQEGGMLYEVNAVDVDEIERVLLNKLQSIKEGNEECLKEHTIHHSQEKDNLRQNKT